MQAGRIRGRNCGFYDDEFVVANNYSLIVCNNTELQTPSRLIFSDYLQQDSDDSLCLKKKIILPAKASKRYTNFTLVAEISDNDQKTQQQLQDNENLMESDNKSSSNQNSSNKHANQDLAQHSTQDFSGINEDDKLSEISTMDNIQYICNFSSLPNCDQEELLSNGEQSVTHKDIISVHSLAADLQSIDKPVMKNGLKICDSCHVFMSKCGCPKMCDTCNKLTTRENLCECRQEYVQNMYSR